MARSDTTQQIIDITLRELMTIGTIGAGLALPGLMTVIDKPLRKQLKHLDERQRAREAKRIIYYMKSRGMLAGDYEFGLKVTKKGLAELSRIDLKLLKIQSPDRWDGLWRMVFYDIPEKHKGERDALTRRLHSLGLFQLQKSIWVHPFACEDVVTKIASSHGLQKYISYIEATHINNQKILIDRFKKRHPGVHF